MIEIWIAGNDPVSHKYCKAWSALFLGISGSADFPEGGLGANVPVSRILTLPNLSAMMITERAGLPQRSTPSPDFSHLT